MEYIEPLMPHVHYKMKFPGVYILYYKLQIQYIGSSLHNIGARIFDHHKSNFFKIDAISWISNIEGRTDFDIRKLENDLIEYNQPKFNVMGKIGSGRYRGRYAQKRHKKPNAIRNAHEI